jgi:hypothetical protein
MEESHTPRETHRSHMRRAIVRVVTTATLLLLLTAASALFRGARRLAAQFTRERRDAIASDGAENLRLTPLKQKVCQGDDRPEIALRPAFDALRPSGSHVGAHHEKRPWSSLLLSRGLSALRLAFERRPRPPTSNPASTFKGPPPRKHDRRLRAYPAVFAQR